MKVLLSIAAGALMFASCGNKASYTVTGTLPTEDMDGQVAYLYDMAGQVKIDSAVVSKNVLKFEGQAEKPALVNLVVADNFVTLFLLENENLTLNSETKKVTGSVLNNNLVSFQDTMEALQGEIQAYQQELMGQTGANSEELQKTMMDKFQNDFMPRMKENAVQFFNDNNNNQLGTLALFMLQGVADSAEIEALVETAGPELQNDETIVALKKEFAASKATEVGSKFVDFEATTEGGKVQKFSDYVGKGKYVLVDFWASWCGPCLAEIPNLKEIYKKYKGDNFELLGVAVWDKQADSEKTIEAEGMTWPEILNTQKIATDAYGIKGIPMIMLFGPDGTILEKGLRGPAIEEALQKYLGK